MPRIFSIATLMLTLAAASAPLFADAQTQREYLATRTLSDPAAAAYLELPAASDYRVFKNTRMLRADIDADGNLDYLLVGHLGRSAVISAFLSIAGDLLEETAYAGFTAIDCDELPSLRVSDVTGDGVEDLRIEATRSNANGDVRRVLKLVTCRDGRLRSIFTGLLDSSENTGIQRMRTTHLVRIKDADADGVNEVEVTTRTVELIREGRTLREIPESVRTTISLYKLGVNGYELHHTAGTGPTEEQWLIVANRLKEAGEVERAAAISCGIVNRNADSVVAAQADAMLKGLSAPDAALVSNTAPESKG